VLDGANLAGAFLAGAQFLNCAQLVATRNWESAFRVRLSTAALLFQIRIPQNRPGCSLLFIYDVRSSAARTHRLCCRRLSYASSPV
jgi:hypothetical protein